MTTVYWGIVDKLGNTNSDLVATSLNLVTAEPELLLPDIKKARSHTEESYLSCPAFLDYYRNTYIVRSPITTTLTVDYANKYLNMYPQKQEFYDAFVNNRASTLGEKDPFLLSLQFFNLFIADGDCMVEQLPASFHTNVPNIRIIPGTFNIGKWYRPLEAAFEVIDPNQPIKITRGDPLYYVRLVPKDGGKIELKHKTYTREQIDAVTSCVTLKKAAPKLPLKVLYKLTERLNMLPKNKCPFNWRK